MTTSEPMWTTFRRLVQRGLKEIRADRYCKMLLVMYRGGRSVLGHKTVQSLVRHS